MTPSDTGLKLKKIQHFFTLKMQFQGILTHKLLDLSTNATPKLLPKL